MSNTEIRTIQEDIRFQTEIIKVISLFILAIGTGSIGIIFSDSITFKTYLLSFFGFIIDLFLFIFIICLPRQ